MYYGEYENGKLSWKLSSGEDDDLEDLTESCQSFDKNKFPWNTKKVGDKFGIALNGKALTYLYENKQDNEELLCEVIGRASVYSRMSPDEKALLVDLLQD